MSATADNPTRQTRARLTPATDWRAEDLTGQRFGRLKVLRQAKKADFRFIRKDLCKVRRIDRRLAKIIDKPGTGYCWLCRCDCGRRTIVRSSVLRAGNSKSCGCLFAPDLTGKRFGKLRVLRLVNLRANGHRQWLCRCDCGRTKVILGNSLCTGGTRSCGCSPKGRRFTSSRIKKEVREKEQILDDGEWHYAPRKAARYVGQTAAALRRWRFSCPWRQGQGIETRRFRAVTGQETAYYPKSRLDEIIRARAAFRPTPKVPGLVPIADACQALGCSEKTVRRRLKAKRIKVRRIRGTSSDGRCLPRAYVPLSFVDECKKERASAARPEKITRNETNGQAMAPIVPEAERGTRRRRGRPPGTFDRRAQDRKNQILDDWKQGRFETIVDLARAHHVTRAWASRIINERANKN